MRPFIRRKKKEFTCGMCGKNGDSILPSEYNFKHGVETKPLCMTCANSMRFSAIGNYIVKGYEIREANHGMEII